MVARWSGAVADGEADEAGAAEGEELDVVEEEQAVAAASSPATAQHNKVRSIMSFP
ncbi:hypothetical protein KO481_08125 [Nocardia sp. NEAU-G5]|uniref:Uncharacterized protein n=1 Tax=Nocardia albiluteola TaxID=2842303 RepID=A0ABS6ATX8_9NOCA|nr:hypothetical protein [Nocardia albiluteola]MBU3061489.1 hypothetical protein [Nocardia albiluteola]